ncbi:MAG: hypothetical protein ABMB14_05065 [Myxococcota bacterium]
MKRLWVLTILVVGCGKQSSIPAELLDLEGTAEHAYDKALVDDFASVQGDAETIASAWASYRGTAEADGASPSDLTSMDDAVSALSAAAGATGDGIALARVANGVSAPMDELFGLYDDPVPPAVLALDYGGREVSLDSLEEGLDDAAQDIDELDAVWATVRDEVVSAGGEAEASAYDASLLRQHELATAGDAAGLLAESNNGLELVDALEGVFGG